MKDIKEVLMERDHMSEEEAEELIRAARAQMYDYLRRGDINAAYEVCGEYFGLEPDYLPQLI